MENAITIDPRKLIEQHEVGPEKRVVDFQDMFVWYRSKAYHDLIGYINCTSTAIQGIKLRDEIYESETMKKLINIFDQLEEIVDNVPPLEQPQRFGNQAYRSWCRIMHRDIFKMLQEAVPQSKCESLNELGIYISNSFGNATRIDYGTGHELSFIFFLCALFKAEILTEEDTVAAALRLFMTYLEFVRRLQKTYHMEPAGSQGVWSLDDYQFIPFIWGSAQLAYKSPFDPSKFLDEPIINNYKADYMFIDCIDYISKMKTGHFGEHSNQLWSITAVPSWIKINSGLVKMYQNEILSKFPVIQHVFFGDLMSFEQTTPGVPLAVARLGYVKPKSERSSANMPPPKAPSSSDDTQSDTSSDITVGDGNLLMRPRTDSIPEQPITESANIFYPMPNANARSPTMNVVHSLISLVSVRKDSDSE